MRSKLVVWGYLVVLSLGTILSLYMPKTEVAAKESIVIPGEAIRLRILANSDFESDQAIKRKVRDAVNAQITLWVQDLTSMEKARTVITSKLPEIQEIAEKTVREQGSDQSVKVEFGKVQFPTKLYGQFLYPAGEYQAILITLGKGEGANWWCVLYPPLCFLDFSNGVAVSEGFEGEKKAKAEMAVEKEAEVEPKAKVQPVKKEIAVTDPDEDEIMNRKKYIGDEEEEVVEHKKSVQVEKKTVKKEEKKVKKQAPVYTEQDEEPVKVKFFVVEMWEKLMY
ncbi:stage II sporulation protein R [Bacillus sp. SORGH_AS_0510]|uniref:stage II sporulation protein R n=1 Tax=Bacillus sp. SORGH_AS_0510 TaxID=3041771 RepID=UPI0027D89BCB|nr:stage II sporulation protein R [Bacillus sp. SORGH_AS_0510]